MSRPFSRYQKEMEFALESVSQAAQVIKTIRAEMVQPAFTKNDESPVTIADFAGQALIAKRLLEKFPKDALVGEESATELRKESGQKTIERIGHFLQPVLGKQTPATLCDWVDHGNQNPCARYWTLDPIDGTKGFIRGDQYAVALALIEDGDVKVSVMACPNLKEAHTADIGGAGTLACAVRGEGAWANDLSGAGSWNRLQVSKHDEGAVAVMLRSFEKKHTDSPRMKKFSEQLGLFLPPIFMDSLAKYVVLAAGHADLLLRFPTEDHPYEWIWDQASGTIMVEEAGGRVTDLDGKPLDYTAGRQLKANRGVLLSNGALHETILQVLKDLKASV